MTSSIQSSGRKWVLVTGASRGIGKTFAERFGREGWNVAVVARSAEDLTALVGTLEKEYGIQTKVIISDLADRQGPRQVYEEIQTSGIRLEGLVNNAGCGVSGDFIEAPHDSYLRMIDLNVRAVFELTHLFLPQMIECGHGLVINVSSTASFQPLPHASVYAATKAFVSFLTEAIWMEVRGKGVRVLNLCPGWTKTDFGKASGSSRDFYKIPMAETPEQVVETAFQAIRGNSPTVISGWHYWLLQLVVRLTPHRLLLSILSLIKDYRDKKK